MERIEQLKKDFLEKLKPVITDGTEDWFWQPEVNNFVNQILEAQPVNDYTLVFKNSQRTQVSVESFGLDQESHIVEYSDGVIETRFRGVKRKKNTSVGFELLKIEMFAWEERDANHQKGNQFTSYLPVEYAKQCMDFLNPAWTKPVCFYNGYTISFKNEPSFKISEEKIAPKLLPIFLDVQEEWRRSTAKYGHGTSFHDRMDVISEEYDEVKAEIRKKPENRDMDAIMAESVQLMNVAMTMYLYALNEKSN